MSSLATQDLSTGAQAAPSTPQPAPPRDELCAAGQTGANQSGASATTKDEQNRPLTVHIASMQGLAPPHGGPWIRGARSSRASRSSSHGSAVLAG